MKLWKIKRWWGIKMGWICPTCHADMNEIAWVPFGFPLGWIAARAAEGKYELALLDLVVCLALIGVLSLVGWLEDRPQS